MIEDIEQRAIYYTGFLIFLKICKTFSYLKKHLQKKIFKEKIIVSTFDKYTNNICQAPSTPKHSLNCVCIYLQHIE